MADLLNIGTSGLMAYQHALTTTSHNISNVNTEGYSRQTVELAARRAEYAGFGFIGTGVDASNVKRNYNDFLGEQVRKQTSSLGSFDAFHTLTAQIDNLLADPTAGLTPVMEEFFNASQLVSDSPSSIPARQVMLSSANSFSDRFHYIDQRLRDLNGRANKQLEVSVQEINSLATNIAKMNEEIARARGASGGKDPNDLLDRRDLLLKQLSQMVSVSTVEQDDGQVNVFIGSGQGLVVGTTTTNLAVVADELIPDRRQVAIQANGASVNISNLLNGGQVGGTLDFINNILIGSRNALGRVAVGITEELNSQHALGLDLNGNLGTDLFTAQTPQVLVDGGNAAIGQPLTAYVDSTQLTTEDYQLEFDGAAWNLRNYRTGQPIPWTAGTGTAVDPYIVDGISIDLSAIAGAAAGDRFLIRPTSEAASRFGVLLDDPARIAAAGALNGQEVVDANGMPLNAGSGRLNGVTPLDDTNLPLPAPVFMTYDAIAQQFNVVGAVPATIPYVPGVDDNLQQSITVGGMPITFSFSGTPQTGDTFTVDNNSNAVADNRNMLALASKQTEGTLIYGSTSFQGAYGQMISSVGTQTQQASVNMDATSTLLRQAEVAHEQTSGVNLDEEAANLLRFQQAYQATAQVITTANQLFQTLLQAF